MAAGERKHANVKVVEQRVALLLRGEHIVNNENDIREAKSDARVHNSGLAQNQLIRSVL